MSVSKRVADRITAGMKRLIPILQQQKVRDVSEADTVTITRDLLAEVFGYDRYAELTGEFSIRGTFCDLGIKIDQKITQLVEVKAVGIALDDRHVRQAVDYAANQGVEWVILTNAMVWRLYKVEFKKPIDRRLIREMNLCDLDPRKDTDMECLYLFSKEGFLRGAHVALCDKQAATSRYILAALLLKDSDVLAALRRELRKVVDVLVREDEIEAVLRNEVIKRDALEGPEAEEATARVMKTQAKPSPRIKRSTTTDSKPDEGEADCQSPTAPEDQATKNAQP
jgi:hypothetical protein